MSPVDLVNFTSEERKMIATLERRIDRLTVAIEDWRGKSPSRALAERASLRWALSEIMGCRS